MKSKEEEKKQHSSQKIKPKGSKLNNEMSVWEKEEAFKENERTVKKLSVEVARL